MSHQTQEISGVPLTTEELKNLINLLKHPEIKKMAQEVKDGKYDKKK